MRRMVAALAALGLTAAIGPTPASAQAGSDGFPNRPIRFVQPFAPGSGPDVTTRFVAKAMADRLGQNIVVENKVGGSGMIAMQELANAPPDGYTLSYANIAIAVSQELLGKGAFSLKRNVTPVGGMGYSINVLVVPPDSPAGSVAELVAMLKAKPGAYSYASGGNGTPAHLNGEIFKRANGVDAVHVPYKGLAPAINDMARGDVHYMFGISGSVMPAITGGRLRPLAVASSKRLPALPNVPTMAEAGYPDNDVQSWSGIIAPPGTPAPVVARLAQALADVLAEPATAKFLESTGGEPAPMSPDAFGRLLASETDRWQRFIRDTKLKID